MSDPVKNAPSSKPADANDDVSAHEKFEAPNMRDPAQLVAFGFGSGLSPKAPGTVGTLAAIPLALLLLQCDFPVYAWWVAASFALGVLVCDIASEKLGVHDHGGIVIDEFIGLFVTFLPIAAGMVAFGWPAIVAGFLLFRFFDVLKPWPIRVLDARVHGGFGVMLDDLVAGLFAAALLWLAAVLLPTLFGPATIAAP